MKSVDPDQVDRDADPDGPNVAAFFDGHVVCEEHPDKPWQHDDCREPGMPPLRRVAPPA
jgi:hypothetical protein